MLFLRVFPSEAVLATLAHRLRPGRSPTLPIAKTGPVFHPCFAGYNVISKGCQTSVACVGAMDCCEGDLCNSAIPTGSSVILLLVSSAIITLFL
uniref:UPAR/Ly6 domain-containing protein n=1 Tax=Lates calcarifer TaxID=8187 RepID=A0A4W6C3H1_LATCA